MILLYESIHTLAKLSLRPESNADDRKAADHKDTADSPISVDLERAYAGSIATKDSVDHHPNAALQPSSSSFDDESSKMSSSSSSSFLPD